MEEASYNARTTLSCDFSADAFLDSCRVEALSSHTRTAHGERYESNFQANRN